MQVNWDTGNKWICPQTEQDGENWEEFTATESHLEMMSSREDEEKKEKDKGGGKIVAECILFPLFFFNKMQALWL